MNLDNPYEKRYFPKSILEGLKFYFKLLDRINIQIYLEKNFPLKRKDIELSIGFLSSIDESDEINRLCMSHPQLTWAMDSIDGYNNLSPEDLSYNEMRVILFLDHLLFTAINIMVINAKIEIPKSIQELSIDDKIKHLIESKYYYTQNESSFPTKFITELESYCNSLIEKYKELKSAEEPNHINEVVKKMIESYLSLVDNNIKSNDLISPLIERNYKDFVYKLKKMLYIPSFYDISASDKEKSFHLYLLGILKGRIEGYQITSNKESGIGRYDIALTPLENENPGVIIEIKKIENNKNFEEELTEALNQISNRHYDFEMSNLGITTIVNIAIVFDGLEPHIEYRIT